MHTNYFCFADASVITKVFMDNVLPHLQIGQSATMIIAYEKQSAKSSPILSPATRRVQGSRLVDETQAKGFLSLNECVADLPGTSVLQAAADCLKLAQTAVQRQMKKLSKSKKKPETEAHMLLGEFLGPLQDKKRAPWYPWP